MVEDTGEEIMRDIPTPTPTARQKASQADTFSTPNPGSRDPTSNPHSINGGLETAVHGLSLTGEGIHSRPMPERGRASSNRRGSSLQGSSSRRHSAPSNQPPLQIPSYPSSSSSDAAQHSPAYQGHYPPPSPYPQPQRQGSYLGQYTMAPLSPAHYPYGSHAYQGVEGGMIPQHSIHANYQPMIQPHAQVYQYPPPSDPSLYQSGASSPTSQQQPSPGPSTSPPPSFGGAGQYHQSIPYSPSPPFYGAPPQQSYPPPSPMYQGQYANPYPTHYSQPSGETDGGQQQGVWWYVANAPTPPSFQGYYSPVGREAESSYYSPPSPPNQPPHFPASPRHYPSDPQSSSNPSDTHAAGVGGPSSAASASASARGPGKGPAEGFSPSEAGSVTHDTKPAVRKSYHPNPPPHRSEWVMWTGNVPADATHDELWRFFNQPPPHLASAHGTGSAVSSSSGGVDGVDGAEPGLTGVVSIFLISRTNCAFINYDSEEHLREAITRFNGQPLRPSDPKCPRLLCRVRRKDDDLKAGVGGQRGMGMHTKWVKDLKGKRRALDDAVSQSGQSESDDFPGSSASSFSEVSEDAGHVKPRSGRQRHSGSSGSYASTTSSMLAKYFPKRYFILKSLTQSDLDLSVQTGMWATQKHNEGILDQAYCTSQEVYLIFGVNKSGEFYGYAKMAGRIRGSESNKVSWAQRTDSSSSIRSSTSPITGRPAPLTAPAEFGLGSSEAPRDQGRGVLGRDTFVDESPLPLSNISQTDPFLERPPITERQSAPEELTEPHRQISLPSDSSTKYSMDYQLLKRAAIGVSLPGSFQLDENAPLAAARSTSALPSSPVSPTSKAPHLHALVEEDEQVVPPATGAAAIDGEADGPDWGEDFPIEWVVVERLPFYRTRNIRNPWNHDREVKVSRDGTELEPSVGAKLLEAWDELFREREAGEAVGSNVVSGGTGGNGGGGGKRGGNRKSTS